MKKISIFVVLDNKKGLLSVVLYLLLMAISAAGILGILGYAVIGSSEYNRMHQMARDIADDPNSHTDEEITNAVKEFHDMANNVVQSGSIVPGQGGGLGVKLLLQGEKAINDVQLQQYVIKIVANPANPDPYEDVTVTVTVLNSLTGTAVQYSVVGTDGYTQNGTLSTDENGQISFSIPGGGEEVTDTITVTVDSVTQTYTYTF